MAIWVKKNASDFTEVKKLWVKKDSLNWAQVKRAWVKKTNSAWTMFWPQSGPAPEEDLYLEVSRNTYPATGSNFPELTLFNYHWEPTTPLTLRYKWQVGPTSSGPWTSLTGYDSFVTYTPGNPSSGNYNTLSFTPDLEEYVEGRVYFNFIMRATGESTSEYSAVSEPVTVNAPIWGVEPSFSGTPAPNNTIAWNVGEAYISGVTDNVGYMTTIYRTKDNGLTKQYLVGTETTPDFSFSYQYDYLYYIFQEDIGYTYYASTYAVFSDIDGEKENATRTATVSGSKTVDGVPGPFSITSATKGLYNGLTRPISISWTTSEYATSYEFSIQTSSDQSNWTDYVVYGNSGIVPPTTSTVYNIGSNASYVRVTMRSTNSTGLYAYTSTVLAVGQAPTAPVITSATSTTTDVVLTFTPPLDNGSSNDIRYWVAYKTSSSSTWGNFSLATVNNNTIRFYDILSSGTSYDFKIKAQNFDLLYSPESNIYTISTKIAPGPFTDVFAKSFDSGYITTFFTTGTNTSNVNVDYLWFQTQPPLGDSTNFDIPASSLQKYYASNTTALLYPNEAYNVSLTASNADGLSTDYGLVFYVYPDGSDKPTAFTPTFSSITGSGFTANFNIGGSANQAIIDLKNNGSSVSGYPKTISVNSGANSYSIPETLSNSTTYTFYVTPKYTDSIYTSFSYTGSQVYANVTTLYQFAMGKTLHVGTNGYIGLTGASSLVALPSTGIALSIYGGDFVQAQTAGADGSGLLHYWSNSDTYVVRWSGYRYGYLNNGNYRVTYEAKFYTNQSYCDIKYLHIGSSVWSSGAPTSTPGIYANGNLISNGIPGPYVLSTGNTYRIYYNGSMPTASISFTDVEQADMISAGGVSGGSSDDGYTSLSTTTNQYTFPTISFGLATLTSSSISIPLSGTYYSYDYTIRSGSYSGTIVSFGNNQTGSTISASGLSSGTTYYLTASPKNFWLQYGNNTQNSYTTTSDLTAPTITSVSVSSVSGPVTAYFTGGSGPYYQIYWTTVNPLPVQSYTPDATGSSSPITDNTGPSTSTTTYMYVRSVASLNETSVGPSAVASSWSSGYPFNMISKLSTPTNVSASDNRSDGIQVSWTNVSNAATYGVWWGGVPSYDSSPDFGGPNNNGGKTITSSPFLDDGVTTGTTRSYYVQAFPSIGSTTYVKSDWSVGDSGTRVAATVAPTITSGSISPTSGTAGSTTFTASASGVSGTPTPTLSYQWQYFSSSSFSYVNVSGATSSSYLPPANFNTLYPNYGFYCLITATNSAGSATVRPSATLNSPATAVAPSTPGTPTLTYVSGNNTSTSYGYSATWANSSTGTTPISYYLRCYGSSDNYASQQQTRGPFTTGASAQSFLLPKTSGLWKVAVYASNSAGTSSTSLKSNSA